MGRKRKKQQPPPPPAAPAESVDDVFRRLLSRAGIEDAQMKTALRRLRKLREEHPRDTPAGLFERAKKAGLPVPPPRCVHHVQRGQCVVCDPAIGERYYLTAGGNHIHTTPACRALEAGQDKVSQRGGMPEPIEVVRHVPSVTEGRDPCKTCFKGQSTHDPMPARKAPRRGGLDKARTVTLTYEDAPAVGDIITHGGQQGTVVAVNANGVKYLVNGLHLNAPWGSLARIEAAK